MKALTRRRTTAPSRPWGESPSLTTAATPIRTASPHSIPVPDCAHPTPRAIRVHRSPR